MMHIKTMDNSYVTDCVHYIFKDLAIFNNLGFFGPKSKHREGFIMNINSDP